MSTGVDARDRRHSVGNIAVGDTASPGLATLPVGKDQAKASRSRQRALSGSYRTVTGPDGRQTRVATPKASGIRRLWYSYRELTYNNTWITPLVLMLGVLAAFGLSADKSEKNPLHKFICLSYRIEGSDPVMYGKGKKDFAFVAFYMIFFTFVREFCMQMVLRPIAYKCGITKKGKVSRFMEQTYSMLYYGLSGPFGLYIMYYTPIWYFDTPAFYENYPHKSHEALFKIFYLGQAAFWGQQSVVLMLQLEKPRKDFKELVFHHIVTIALIFLSYRFHFTWMGLAVYVTMDISDFFLATSKTLNYLDSAITGPFFIMFMGVWIYLRHYLNLRILYSILTEFATVGPYELDWTTQQYKCWISQIITFFLLFALQLVNSYWLFLILRIAYRYIFHSIQKDERSDDEDDEDEPTSPIDTPVEDPKKK
uniref:ARAD1C35134p n=1 Tax=Blastobotrys adeninivorans TaxID=409370 RepID=A0A060T2S4_BLAAD